MPNEELLVRVDEDLLTKARALAERKRTSVEDLVVAFLTRLVAEDKRRRLTREMMKPYVDRPTVQLTSQRPRPEGDSEE